MVLMAIKITVIWVGSYIIDDRLATETHSRKNVPDYLEIPHVSLAYVLTIKLPWELHSL